VRPSARDAAGRGVRVVLFEQSDPRFGNLVGSTSSFIGGLALSRARRVADGARGARRARGCCSRTRRNISGRCASCCRRCPAPRSPQMLRFGLFLYDWLGRAGSCPARRASTSPTTPAGHPLMRRFIMGYEYSDCWVDDSRLWCSNALGRPHERGATIRTRTRVSRAGARGHLAADPQHPGPPRRRHRAGADQRRGALGRHRRRDRAAGRKAGRRSGSPRAAISWCRRPSITTAATSSRTPTAASSSRCPFHDDFTMIGTTDENFTGALDSVAPSGRRRDVSLPRRERVFPASRSSPSQVVWAFAGVRSLYDESSGRDAPEGRHARLSPGARRAPRRRSGAHRLWRQDPPRIGSLPRTRWSRPRISSLQLHRRWTASTGRCPAAISSGTAINTGVADLARLAVPHRARSVAAGACLRHPRRPACSVRPRPRRDRAVLRPASAPPKCAI